MKNQVFNKEFLVMNVRESKGIDPSFVIEINGDTVRQFVRDSDTPLILEDDCTMVPLEIRTDKPFDNIDFTICVVGEKMNHPSFRVQLNWYDLILDGNKTYVHRDTYLPIKGEFLVLPMMVDHVEFKDGSSLYREEDSKVFMVNNFKF